MAVRLLRFGYNRLADDYERVKRELAYTEAAITDKAVQRDTVERFLEELGKQKKPLMSFDIAVEL